MNAREKVNRHDLYDLVNTSYNNGGIKGAQLESRNHSQILPDFNQINLLINMKAFAVLLSCLAVASAQIDCETCKAGVTKLGQYLTTPEEIEKEVLLLKTFVCEVDADPEGCAAGVDKYWAGMAEAIFGYEETPADICSAGGICKKSARALDCETCAGLIGSLSDLFKNEDFINSVLEKVSGFLYCDNADDAAECKAFVAAYGAAAMPVLGDGLVTEAESICDALGCE